MSLRALTIAINLRGRLAGSVVAAMTLASIGTAVFALPAAAAATATADPVADTIRSGPHPAPRLSQTPAIGARTGAANPAVAPRVAPNCDSTFHQVAGVNPGMAYNLVMNNSMTSLSANDVWAVGVYGNSNNGPDQKLVTKWDGSTWTQVPTTNSGFGNDTLWGVTSVPGATADIGNVWTVGDYTDSVGVEHPQALEWVTPGQWAAFQPANFSGGNNVLFAAAAIAANNVYAVGFWRQDNGNPSVTPPIPPAPSRTLIGHWDGTNFTTVTSLDVTMTSSDRLLDVSASGPSDVWAVGRSLETGVSHTLILHYDGTGWSITPSPNPGPLTNVLYGVKAMSSSLAYAVGNYTDTNGRSHTLFEQWNGTTWSVIPTPDWAGGINDNLLFSVSALSPTNIWTAGAIYAPTQTGSPSDTLVEHWDGSQWKIVPSVDGNNGNWNELNAILAVSPAEIWAAGDYVDPSNIGLTLTERLCIGTPPTVSAVAPISGNTTTATRVTISGTGFNFATAVKFGSSAASSFTINSDTQITATAPPAVVGTVDVTVTNPAGASATSPADTYIYVPPAISWQQYSLAGSDGATWQPIDAPNLTVAFQPSVDSMAILSGNADLWTSLNGVNQDLGLMVTGGAYGSGTVVGWKESGGFAGTFSPNAAFVQTVIPLTAMGLYDVKLVWKANKATSGTIFAAAGGPNYSPSRLTVEMVPTSSTNLRTAFTNKQYNLAGSDGSTWQDLDATNLAIATYTPSASGAALVSANADLWTATAGVNQDLAIVVSGGTFGAGTIVGWKESGGYGGTFSPNAAYAQSVIPLIGGTAYTIKLQWKANKNTAGTIFAAAGSGPAPNYSPTRLTLRLFPAGTGLQDAMTNLQYNKAGSTGADWTPIDGTGPKVTVNPTANSVWVLSANADLWTSTVGVNQDIGIFISGGAYGSGTLVAWKESGGFAGTFSPNAAFVQTVIPLAMGVNYTITLEWKANLATGGTIYAAAGSGPYSPTRITAQLLS